MLMGRLPRMQTNLFNVLRRKNDGAFRLQRPFTHRAMDGVLREVGTSLKYLGFGDRQRRRQEK